MMKPSDNNVENWIEEIHREHYDSFLRYAQVCFRIFGVRMGCPSISMKNRAMVMSNALQIASSVEIVGKLFRLNILLIVEEGNPDSFPKRYADQPRSFINSLILVIVSIDSAPFIFYLL